MKIYKITVKYNSSDERPSILVKEYQGRFYWNIRTIKYTKVFNLFIPINIKLGITEDFKRSISFK